MIGLFCIIASLLYVSFAKETYHFINFTNCSHPICILYTFTHTHVSQMPVYIFFNTNIQIGYFKNVSVQNYKFDQFVTYTYRYIHTAHTQHTYVPSLIFTLFLEFIKHTHKMSVYRSDTTLLIK